MRKKYLINKKKAISPIIGTVLLIVITISLFGVLFGIVVPLVRERLEASSCIDYMDYIQFVNSEYTCYSMTSEITSLEIERDFEKKEISSILVTISNSTSSKVFEIYDRETNDECEELTTLGVDAEGYKCAPKPGEAIIYDFDFKESETAYLSIKLENEVVCDKISVISRLKRCL
jgi:flagellin-like protein